jgi:hypothetical protein
VLATTLVLAGTASAGTKFDSTWKNPDAKPASFRGKKVIALVVSNEEAARRGAEDELAHQITLRGPQGVAAYRILPAGKAKDKETAKAAFEKEGAVGVVVMRVLGKEQEMSSQGGGMWYTSGAYGSFYGSYWGAGWNAVYTPGYLRTETMVTVETLVYSLEQDKLIWGGRSKTTNPKRVDTAIHDLANMVAKEMKKAGLTSPAAK